MTRNLVARIVAGLLLVAAGAAGMYLYERSTPRPLAPAASSPTAAASPAPAAEVHEALLVLTPDARSRIGLQTAAARLGPASRRLSIPGVVEPNAYKQLLVTAFAAGRVQSVSAELGARVTQGQPLATIHSPELAEAERVYVSMRAELAAAHQRLVRVEGLVKIGAESRQALESAQVEHTTHATDVEGARARLRLLGVPVDTINALVDPGRIDPVMTVTAPAGGIVTRRAINPGQNVSTSTELFTIVDLSSVWVVGDVYERDLSRVRIGSRASMTSPAAPGETWTGRVAYVDPQVAIETRTARLRVETTNPGERLRLGMFLDLAVEDASPVPVLLVPRSAVQTIGAQSVVYVAAPGDGGRFSERAVRLGATSGEDVEITAGLKDGDRVVSAGSFFLRAERDRLGLPPPVVR